MEVVALIGIIALAALCGWAALRMEPHWVSRDGRRIICSSQLLDPRGTPLGRWKETRLVLDRPGHVQVQEKHGFKRTTSIWKVARQSDEPPRNKEIVVLTGTDRNGAAAMMTVRIPRKSRAVGVLQDVVGATTPASPTPSSPGPGSG